MCEYFGEEIGTPDSLQSENTSPASQSRQFNVSTCLASGPKAMIHYLAKEPHDLWSVHRPPSFKYVARSFTSNFLSRSSQQSLAPFYSTRGEGVPFLIPNMAPKKRAAPREPKGKSSKVAKVPYLDIEFGEIWLMA